MFTTLLVLAVPLPQPRLYIVCVSVCWTRAPPTLTPAPPWCSSSMAALLLRDFLGDWYDSFSNRARVELGLGLRQLDVTFTSYLVSTRAANI